MLNGRQGRSRLEDWAWSAFGLTDHGAPHAEGALAAELGATASMEVQDRADAIVLCVDLPGATERDVTIDVEAGQLHLHATRTVTPPKDAQTHRQERRGFDVRRSWALPRTVDASRTDATLKNGVLTITLPKVPEAAPRRIPVNASN